MNMFRARSPFTPPQVPGSSGRQKNQRSMSIEAVEEKRQDEPPKKETIPIPTTFSERFCFSLGVPIKEDESIYWSFEMSPQISCEQTRNLVFREQQYFTKGTLEKEICQTIYILADGVNGYHDKNNIITNRVCALHLCQIQSVIDESDIKTYDLLYKQAQDISWEIPMNLGQLNFRVECETGDKVERKTGELLIPIVCQFDIQHVGK